MYHLATAGPPRSCWLQKHFRISSGSNEILSAQEGEYTVNEVEVEETLGVTEEVIRAN